MQSTLIIAGVVFVGAAIVGGGMVAFKVEVPLIDSLPRQVLLGLFGAVLLVAGVLFDDTGGGLETVVADDATTTVPTTTTTVLTTTTTADPVLLVIDRGGVLAVSVPTDWSVEATDDAIWASPEIEEWIAATKGEGPAAHNGYYVKRLPHPATGTYEEIAEGCLDEMPIPEQCAYLFGDVERPGSGYFTYRVYECAPGGNYVNEVEIGITPGWVTFESSRYMNDVDREEILARIWQSMHAYSTG